MLVLEARDRIGGRCHTLAVGDVQVDVGASWIHGSRCNPLTAIAKTAGLRTVESMSDFHKSSVFDCRLENTVTRVDRATLTAAEAEWELVLKKLAKLQEKGNKDSSCASGINRAVAALTAQGKLRVLLDPALLDMFVMGSLELEYSAPVGGRWREGEGVLGGWRKIVYAHG